MNIAKFSVKQPVLVNLLTVFLIVAGLLSLSRLPRETFPNIPVGVVMVSAVYPGVSPTEMESLVGMKIEKEIKDIKGIKNITVNSVEGFCNVAIETLEGLPESEHSRIALDVQAAVGRIGDFPADMDKPVTKLLKVEIPVLYAGLSSKLTEYETRQMAKDIQEDLERIKGISSVAIMGLRDLELKITVNPEKLKSHNLDIKQVMALVSAHSSDIPGGTIKAGRTEYLIRIPAKKDNPMSLKSIVVKASPTGVVKLGEIAEITDALADPVAVSRVSGERGLYLLVNKTSDADSIKVADKFMEYMNKFNKNATDGIKLEVLWDSSRYIKIRQATLYSNGISGLILVTLLLFVFLNFRAALMTALGIPVAFFGTFIFMHYMGITFNMMAMFGLIIALGMIVDDAIVVVENIFRYNMQGMDPKEAAIKGANEVFWPVIGSVSTTVVAFMTLTVMPGVMGKILAIIPMVVAIALVVSLVEALLVLPSHMAHYGKGGKGIAEKKESRWFIAFQNGFGWLLTKITRWWPISIAFFLGVFMFSGWFAGNKLEFDAFPAKTITGITINGETAVGSTIEYTESAAKKVEKFLATAGKKEVDASFCTVGSAQVGHDIITGNHVFQCMVRFSNDGKTSPRKPTEIIRKWREDFASISELEKINVNIMKNGPPSGKPIEIQIRGKNHKNLQAVSAEIQKFGATIKGVTDIYDDEATGKRELLVMVDSERAAGYGLDSAQVGLAVRRAFAGGIATRFQRNDDNVNVVVRYPENRRVTVQELRDFEITSPVTGKGIVLSAIAEIKEGKGPGQLKRVNQMRTITVSGEIDVDTTTVSKVNGAIMKLTDKLKIQYPDVDIVYKGETETSSELVDSIIMALILALLGIYIILATIFQSFGQPFIVLMAIPFGAIGVVFGLWLHDQPISMIALLGIVSLLGVVVNDSIVIVEFINNKVKEGIAVKDAVIEGGKLRLRPVMLTTLTTIFGLLPMAMGWFGSEPWLEPMAIVIVWGLAFSTLLTLLLVPCMYLFIDFLKRSGARLINFVTPGRKE